jgi:N-carbamoyl-L-amino-acid hydrolase
LRVDGDRVLADLRALRAIGAYKTGVHKPTFSEPHMRSLAWLAERLPEAGLAAEIDGIGNVLGVSNKAGPKLLAGSHLESQNYAGWLDGPLGVIYALEAARVINPDPNLRGAVEVASWCDEEGHFGHFLGSRSYVGTVTEADIDAAQDRSSGKSMRERCAIVVLPSCPCNVRARPAYRISRSPYRTGRDAGKQPPRDRHRHLHRRHLAVPDRIHRRAKPRRHHADGGPQGCRPRARQGLRRHR